MTDRTGGLVRRGTEWGGPIGGSEAWGHTNPIEISERTNRQGFRLYTNPEARTLPEIQFIFNGDGELEAYAIAGGSDTPENVLRTKQVEPGIDKWTDWEPVSPQNDNYRMVQAFCDDSGSMHVFLVGKGNSAIQIRQNDDRENDDGSWGEKIRLGSDDSNLEYLLPVQHPAADGEREGRMEVFGVGTGRGIAHILKDKHGQWGEKWEYIGTERKEGILQDVIQYPNGRTEVFVAEAGTGRLYRSSRSSIDEPWSEWLGL